MEVKNLNETQKKMCRELFVSGSLPNRTLADRLGISYPGLTLAAEPLVRKKVLLKGKEAPTGKVGRTEENLCLNPKAFYMLGIDIRRHSYLVCLTDFTGAEVEKKKIMTLLELADYIKQLKEGYTPIMGIGVTIRGYYNFGRFLEENIEFVSVLDECRLPYHCLSYVESLACIYKLHHQKDDNFLLLKYGPYVDSAIFVNGKCVKDGNGQAADVARTYVDGETLGEGYWFRALLQGEKPEPEQALDMLKAQPAQYERFISAMAKTIVNADATCALERVILTGYIFQDDEVNSDLEDAILEINPDYDTNKNVHYDGYDEVADRKGALQVFIDNFCI
ncbi:MAG: hypothetical protein Q4F15_00325 [Bacillota bacterium]|nr:hypothetical protein [Bacillota bacterium]